MSDAGRVLTPHDGEYTQLTGHPPGADRIDAARRLAAERGYVDAVIPPSHTRGQIANALRLLQRKMVVMPQRKHGNIPL